MKQKKQITAILVLGLIMLTSSMVFSQKTGDVTQVTTIDVLPTPSIFKQVWQPYLAMWEDNHYVVSYGLKLDGRSDMGDIVCSITKNGGKKWTAPIMIFDHRLHNGTQRYAYANGVLFRPQGEDIIWCFAMRCPLSFTDSEDADLVAAYSCDGGYSWIHVELWMDFHSPLITNAGVVTLMENGIPKYLLPVHRNSIRHDPLGGDREQFVLESTNLLNWKIRSFIPRPDEVWVHEGNIAEGDHPGELKIVMRTAKYYERKEALDSRLAYSSVSSDNGKTWSMAVAEPALHNAAAKGFFGKDAKGRHIYVYNDGARSERKGLYYVTREPGKEWSKPSLFYWDNNNHNSYATLIEKEPGVFLCVWDSSDDPDVKRSVIRFGILDLND